MSKVNRYCSISNYVKHNNGPLYELVQDLCIGRIFTPRKNSPGITLLNPDKDLTKKLLNLAKGNDDDATVKAVQSLVLLDHLPNPSDFDPTNNDDIPTYLRKKLLVASVKGNKVNLKNGGVLELDTKFKTREDRNNMAVYTLSKALVDTNTEEAKLPAGERKRRSAKTGGGEYLHSRELFMNRLITRYKRDDSTDPFMEVLVSLCEYLEKNDSENYKDVCSLLSNDTLASLVIILQPYRKNHTYIDDNEWKLFCNQYNDNAITYYSYVSEPVKSYKQHMEKGKLNNNSYASLLGLADNCYNLISKLTSTSTLLNFYKLLENKNLLNGLNMRKNTLKGDIPLALCEAELRITSAIMYDSKTKYNNLLEGDNLKLKYNLNEPWLITSTDLDVAFYYSVVVGVVKSNALFYTPNNNPTWVDLCGDNIVDSNTHIDLNKVFNNHMEEINNTYTNIKDSLQQMLQLHNYPSQTEAQSAQTE